MNKGIRFTDEFKQDAVARLLSVDMRLAKWRNVWGLALTPCTLGRPSLRSRHVSDQRLLNRLQRSNG